MIKTLQVIEWLGKHGRCSSWQADSSIGFDMQFWITLVNPGAKWRDTSEEWNEAWEALQGNSPTYVFSFNPTGECSQSVRTIIPIATDDHVNPGDFCKHNDCYFGAFSHDFGWHFSSLPLSGPWSPGFQRHLRNLNSLSLIHVFVVIAIWLHQCQMPYGYHCANQLQ